MNNYQKTEDLAAETHRLRVQFLDRELDLTETLIELVRFETAQGETIHGSQGIEHAMQGLETVRKFAPLIESAADRDRIQKRLAGLEAQLSSAQTQAGVPTCHPIVLS